MKLKHLFFPSLFVIALLQLSVSGSAQQKVERTGKPIELNYKSFPSREKVNSETWKQLNAGKGYSEQAFYQVFPDDTTKYVEVISKRNELENFYVNPNDPAQFSLVKALYAVNFQRNGEWVVIDPQLQANGKDVYEATDQPNPVGINVRSKESYIQAGGDKVQFNNWVLYGENGNGKVLLAKADWSQYTIGADGIRITNVFPGIDAEMQVRRGAIKTNFIVRQLNYTQYDKLYFEDSFSGLGEKGLFFEEGNNDHAEAVFAAGTDSKDVVKINPAVAYAKSNPSAAQPFPFHIEGNKLSIVIPAQYLVDNLVTGDVIIDPLVQSVQTMALASAGMMYNASCGFTNSCDYTISITPPARATITNVASRVFILATAPCNINNAAFRVSMGTCVSPGGGSYWIANIASPGGFDIGYGTENLMACAPAPSCTPVPINVNFHLMRGCVGPTGCDNTCVGTGAPLSVRIQGRTAELTPVIVTPNDTLCFGQNFTFTTSTAFGVPPFDIIWWELNSTGSGVGTGSSVTLGSTYPPGTYTLTAHTNDACITPASATATFVILSSKVLYVDDLNGNDGNCGNSWANSFKTVSRALTIANANYDVDSILVAAGTYYPTVTQSGTNRDSSLLIGREKLKIFGGYPNGGGVRDIVNNPTILSGDIGVPNDSLDNSYHVLVIARTFGPDSLVLDGFTITKGNANGTGSFDYQLRTISRASGGGINIRDLGDVTVLRNLTIKENTARVNGGGTYAVPLWEPVFQNCVFSNNRALERGGGFAAENGGPILIGCSFINNAAILHGGGAYNSAAATKYTNCSFINNTAGTATVSGWGGGMSSRMFSGVTTVDSCSFTGNSATSGGGGAISEGGVQIKFSHCSFTTNRVSNAAGNIGTGGGVQVGSSGIMQLINCVVANNVAAGTADDGGGGIMAYSNGVVTCTNTTIYGNTTLSTSRPNAAGTSNMAGTTLNLRNSIVWGPGQQYSTLGTFNVDHSLVKGYPGALPNLNLDPLFVNASNPAGPDGIWQTTDDGLHLTTCSPAVNMGDNALVLTPNDMASGTRIVDVAVDMGAYELQTVLPIITLSDFTMTYGDADLPIPGTVNCSGLTTTFTIADNNVATMVGNSIHIVNAGVTTLTAHTINGTPDVTVNLTVNRKQVTLSLATTPVVKVYDGNRNAAVTVANLVTPPGSFVGTDVVGLALSSNIGSYDTKDVGNGKLVTIPLANISLTGIKAANYVITNTTDLSANVGVINRLQIAITIGAQVKVYGDADPVLTYTFSPALPGTEVFTGSLGRLPGEDVGVYPIGPGSLSLNSNYTMNYFANSLRIEPRTVVVTAEQKTKVYGDADPALTYTFTPALIGTDAFTGSLGRVPGENVGSYAINQGTLSPGTNYTVTYLGSSMTITPRAITVTAAPKTKVYGAADPALTYTYAPALIGADVFTGSLTRFPGEDVGIYTINQGTLALSANYTLTYVGNTLTITSRVITVTVAPKTKVYGDADPALTYTFTPALASTDVFTGSLTRVAGENVGTYAINQGTLALSANYTLTYVGSNLTITPRAITVTAASKTKVYGDTDPALTYTFAPALIGTDAFSGSLVRVAGENVGIYAINQGTLSLSTNYTLTYAGSNLVITPKAITVTAGPKTKVYGDADPVLTYTFLPALIGADVFSGSLVRVAGENVGTYAINQGTLSLSANYTLTYVGGNLVISPKGIAVTAAPKTKVYGDADPALTYTFSPALIGTDAFTGSLTRAAGENVGVYAINQGTVALSTNYTITYVSNNLVIIPKVITVRAEPKTKVYGDADPALTYTFSPALSGADVFTGALTRVAGENAGSYAINQGSVILSANYQLIYVPANLVITKAVLTVTANDKSICFGDPVGALTVNYSGFRFTDNASSLSAQPFVTPPVITSPGNYRLMPGSGSSINYDFVYVEGQLTVRPSPQGVITQVLIGPGVITTPGVVGGEQLTAPLGTGYTYIWNTGERLPSIFVRSEGQYSVEVTNPQACSRTFTIVVKQRTIIVPNIFSPNGDGINDKWVIENLKNYPGNMVQIYNRYGQAVHKITNYMPWDGRINGKDMPIGTYYYIIDPKNGLKPITGFIDIIR